MSELNVGGILVESLPNVAETYEGKDQTELYGALVDDKGLGSSAATFVQLKGIIGGPSTGAPFGDEVKSAGLGPKIVENALRTMIDAGQLEYLRLAGIPNKDWRSWSRCTTSGPAPRTWPGSTRTRRARASS